MNWQQLLQLALLGFQQIIPVVMSVEKAHSDKAGTDKKQIAMQTITAASNIAAAATPQNVQQIQGLTNVLSAAVDSTVAALQANQVGPFAGGGTAQKPQ